MKIVFLKYSVIFILLSTVACSPVSVSQQKNTLNIKNVERTSIKNANNDVSINQPVIIPPAQGNRYIDSGYQDTQTLPNGLPALSPSKNLKIETLFTEKIKDTKGRIERLENAHIDFRKEYEQLKPAIVRLAAIESDLQALMTELNSFVGDQTSSDISPSTNSSITDVQATPLDASAPTAKTSTSIQTSSKSDGISSHIKLKKIRIGNHPDKVRLVIETNIKTSYAVNLDNDSQILTVRFENTVVDNQLPLQKTLSKNPLLKGYRIITTDTATEVSIDLKQTTSLKNDTVLNAVNKSKNVRFVIDFNI